MPGRGSPPSRVQPSRLSLRGLAEPPAAGQENSPAKGAPAGVGECRGETRTSTRPARRTVPRWNPLGWPVERAAWRGRPEHCTGHRPATRVSSPCGSPRGAPPPRADPRHERRSTLQHWPAQRVPIRERGGEPRTGRGTENEEGCERRVPQETLAGVSPPRGRRRAGNSFASQPPSNRPRSGTERKPAAHPLGQAPPLGARHRHLDRHGRPSMLGCMWFPSTPKSMWTAPHATTLRRLCNSD